MQFCEECVIQYYIAEVMRYTHSTILFIVLLHSFNTNLYKLLYHLEVLLSTVTPLSIHIIVDFSHSLRWRDAGLVPWHHQPRLAVCH